MEMTDQKRIYEKLQHYQNFSAPAEMAQAVELHIRNNDLSETQLRVLRVLEFRSKMIPGASWIKVSTICDVVKKSDATVRRALRKLEQLGIIERVATLRVKTGGTGANVYVISAPETHREQSNDQAGMTSRTDDGNPRHTANTAQFATTKEDYSKDAQSKILSNNVQTASMEDRLDKSFTPGSVPSEFRDLVGRYYNDAEKIYHLYNRCVIASKAAGLDYVDDELAIQAFKQTVFNYKRGAIRGSFDGYFYGVYFNTAVVEVRRQVMGESMPVW